jgi:hypothetical protein
MIRQWKTKRFEGLEWKSGHFYKFKYKAAENDRKPHIIFMYAYSGTHPRTGREWRFFQAINFTYIPRKIRRRFMKTYLEARDKNPNMKFVWDSVKRKYPWLRIAIRRYFYTPGTYIISPKEIPFEQAEDVIVSTWAKDFSKQTIIKLRSKIRKSLEKRGKAKKRKKKIISEKRFKSPRYWTHKDTPRQHGL